MKMQLVGLLAVAVAGCSSTARAAPVPWRRAVLVELYTSQGCSSCPPADAFVRELPGLGFGRDKVIPLTFHVDYWDRLGWKDPFASGAFTDRQQWYARSASLRSPDGAAGLDGLYTPQMIVDGTVQFSGQRRQVALREMERAAGRPPPLDLAVRATASKGATVDIVVEGAFWGDASRDRDWRIVAALAARRARTAVGRGENAGETLEEAAVVRALADRVPLPPRGAAHLQLSRPADLAWSDVDIVVFAQSEATREIGSVRALDGRQLGIRQ